MKPLRLLWPKASTSSASTPSPGCDLTGSDVTTAQRTHTNEETNFQLV